MRIKVPTDFKDGKLDNLKIGDRVFLNGTIFTARDKASELLASDKKIDFPLSNHCIFHCGPVTKKDSSGYEIISAGPTTSSRTEIFLEKIVKKRKVKAFLGKGGFSREASKIFKKHRVIYLSATGGAGVFLAEKMKFKKVFYLEEFGPCEAVWQLEIKDLPCVVAIDSKGNSLYEPSQNRIQDKNSLLLSLSSFS